MFECIEGGAFGVTPNLTNNTGQNKIRSYDNINTKIINYIYSNKIKITKIKSIVKYSYIKSYSNYKNLIIKLSVSK